MESLTAGGQLQTARTIWLDRLAGRDRILSVGEGHGRFAEACVARFPRIQLDCVDSSPLMIARARARLGTASDMAHWHCADVLAWTPRQKYDAIVTCFFLDCFPPEQLAAVVTTLAECATHDAIWLMVDFAIPSRGVRRWRAQAVHALMYAFFRCTTALPARHLTPPAPFLRAEGFLPQCRREFNLGLIAAELWCRECRPAGTNEETTTKCP